MLEDGTRVKVHYKGMLTDGRVFDSSIGIDPFEFTIGDGKAIPCFEKAVKAMAPGEHKTVTIPCAEAFGPYHEERKETAPMDGVPLGAKMKVGHSYELNKDGMTLIAKLEKIENGIGTFDFNHPLAGEDIVFDLKIVEAIPPDQQ